MTTNQVYSSSSKHDAGINTSEPGNLQASARNRLSACPRGTSFFVRSIQRQPTFQPTKCVVLCDQRVFRQSPQSCKLLKYLPLPYSHGGSHRFESCSAHHFFNGLRATAKKPVPQIFHNSLDHLRGDSHLPEKRALSRPCLLPVALGVQVERGLNTAVAKQALDCLWLGFALVHQPA
jgi:hypothetical protein